MTNIHSIFTEASQHWDLETLFNDLASAKGKHLTPVEKLHLRGLLCGHSPSEIAEKLGKNQRGVEADLCATIYRYVKFLLDKTEAKIENWRNIADWLEESGYKSQMPEIPVDHILPERSIVNIDTVNVERAQIVFQISLRIPKSDFEELVKDLDDKADSNGKNS